MTDKAPPQINQMIEGVVTLRDQLDALNAKHKAATDPIKQAIEALQAQLLDICNQTGQTQLGCDRGIAFLKTSSFASMQDWDAFLPWAIEHGRTDMLKKDISKNAVGEYVDQTGEPPPGVKWDTRREIQVRRK